MAVGRGARKATSAGAVKIPLPPGHGHPRNWRSAPRTLPPGPLPLGGLKGTLSQVGNRDLWPTNAALRLPSDWNLALVPWHFGGSGLPRTLKRERDRNSSGPPSPSSRGPSLDGMDQLMAARPPDLDNCRPIRPSWICGTAHPGFERPRTAHPSMSCLSCFRSPTKLTG